MRAPSSYEKRPYVQVSSVDRDCDLGWAQILEVIRARQLKTIAIECYPGVLQQPFVTNLISALSPSSVIHSESAFLPASRTAAEVRRGPHRRSGVWTHVPMGTGGFFRSSTPARGLRARL